MPMCIAPSDILYVDRYLSHEAHAELSARVTQAKDPAGSARRPGKSQTRLA